MPFIFFWGLWIARNEVIFNNRHNSPMEIASKDAGFISFFSDSIPTPRQGVVSHEIINKEIPWGYFDGTVGGVPVRCGGGVAIFLNEDNYLHIRAGFGRGTHNFVKLMALRKLRTKAWEWGARSLHIFGDSKIIIDWANGNHRCNTL